MPSPSASSVPCLSKKSKARPKPVTDGYLEIGDRVKMSCDRFDGQPGFVTHTGVKGSTVPALQVYLYQLDIEIVTVLAHLRRMSKREVA